MLLKSQVSWGKQPNLWPVKQNHGFHVASSHGFHVEVNPIFGVEHGVPFLVGKNGGIPNILWFISSPVNAPQIYQCTFGWDS
jgi:hypothetical protein